jgi:hypothetical protein
MNVFRVNKTVPCANWAISSGQQMAANLQVLGAYSEMLGRLREMHLAVTCAKKKVFVSDVEWKE